MPKSICTTCQTEFKIEQQGVCVVEMFNDPPRPYKIWLADLWKCPGCNQELVTGFAFQPFTEHFEKDFEETYKKVLDNKISPVFFDYEKPFVIQADNIEENLKEGGGV